jgi:hypothetical protein
MVELTLPDGRKVQGSPLSFTPVREEWNEYKLEDGKRFHIKLILTDVFKSDVIDKETGQNIYLAKSQNVIRVQEVGKQ